MVFIWFFFILFALFSHCCPVFVGINSTLLEEESKKAQILYKYLSSSAEATPSERNNFIKKGIDGLFNSIHAPISSKPIGAETTFDCKIKRLAYEFSKKLNSNSNVQQFVFDGLELGELCNEKPHFVEKQNKVVTNSDELLLPHEENEFVIYVDKSKENSNAISDGSFENPFWTIQEAIKKCDSIINSFLSNDICTVKVRKGKYFISESLVINTNNIKITSFGSEDVSITSDKVMQPQWHQYKNEIEEYDGWNPMFEGVSPQKSKGAVKYLGKLANYSLCKEYCAEMTTCTSYVYFNKSVRGFASMCYARVDGMWNAIKTAGAKSGKKVVIYKADLSHADLKVVDQIFVDGRRAIRARFPNGNPETMGLHTKPTGYIPTAEKWLPPRKTETAMKVDIQSPSRNGSLYPFFHLGIGGPVSQFLPPQSFWALTYTLPSGLQYADDLEINLREWKNPSTGIVHSLRGHHWGNWMFQMDGRDMKNRTLNWTWGGFQEAQGTTYGAEWYVENIFEELDSANEWFYDKSTKVLYYSPNGTAEDLPKEISIPQISNLMQIVGSQTLPRKNVKVSGIKFEHSRQTFLKPYFVPSGGDWTIHRNATLFIEGTENVVVENCEFDSPGGNGIFISNYNRETVIKNNLLYRLGDSGIVAVGETHLIDGTHGNQPRGLQIIGNTIFDLGIWGKQTYAFVQSKTCETLLEGNIFFNGPRGGININDGFGGGNQINWNLLFNFLRETNDHGPINTWDRVPYITKVNDGKTASLTPKEHQIHRNFIINNYRSDWPIDHDDGSCYWNDTYNFMVYGGFKNYQGHDKHSIHNVYIYPDVLAHYCAQTSGQTLGTSGYGDVWMANKCVMKSSNVHALGACDIKHLSETIPLFALNQYYTQASSINITCGSTKFTLDTFKKVGMDIGSVNLPLPSDETILKWARDMLEF